MPHASSVQAAATAIDLWDQLGAGYWAAAACVCCLLLVAVTFPHLESKQVGKVTADSLICLHGRTGWSVGGGGFTCSWSQVQFEMQLKALKWQEIVARDILGSSVHLSSSTHLNDHGVHSAYPKFNLNSS